MIKGLVLFSTNMEDAEGIFTRDLLIRAGILVTTATFEKNLLITTAYGISLYVDKFVNQVNIDEYDFLVIPGGKYVNEIIDRSADIQKLIRQFNEKNKLICAICAAPQFLGLAGVIDNKKYTSYPNLGVKSQNSTYLSNCKTVKDGNIITAKSAGAIVEFTKEIIETLLSNKEATKVIHDIYYLE